MYIYNFMVFCGMGSSDNPKSTQTRRRSLEALSRRRFVQGAAGAGAVGIAGCAGQDPEGNGGGNGGGNGNGDPGGNGSADGDVFQLVSWLGEADPTRFQFNPYNVESYYGTAIFESFAHFNLQTFIDDGEREWFYRGLEDWSISEPAEGGVVTLHPNSERTWHDGDDVTAEDVYAKLVLDEAFGSLIGDYMDEVEVAGDTVELTLSRDINEEVFEDVLARVDMNTKYDLYEDWIEQLEDASSDEEVDEIMGELATWDLDEPVGTSPYKLAQMSEQSFTFDVHDEHPVGGEMDIEGVEALAHTTNESKWQYALSDECDMMESGTPKETIEGILDTETFDFMMRFHWLNALALTFNHEDDMFGKREVRQALAYLIDRDMATKAGGYEEGDWGQVRNPQEHLHGVYVGEDAWFDDEFLESLNTYGVNEMRTDEATQLLQEAGYERDGDSWVDESGEPLTIEVDTVGDFGEFVRASQSLEQQLNDFGIQAEVTTGEASTFFDRMYEGDFGMCTGYWGENVHPYDQYQMPFYNAPRNWITTNHPAEVEVPMPVGDPDGSLDTIDVHGLMDELSTSSDEDRNREIVQELAWAYNQSVPQIPIWFRYGQMFLNTSDWEWPDLESLDTKMAFAQEELFRRGWPRSVE